MRSTIVASVGSISRSPVDIVVPVIVRMTRYP
jgi:hypothetical protein